MERSRELRGIMLAIYDDWSRGDDSWIELFAPDDGVLAIGTDPQEWWQSGTNVRAIFKTQISTLVIGARHDTMDRTHIEWMASQFPKGRYLYCAGGSHMAMYDDQETFFGGLTTSVHDAEGSPPG